MHGPNMAVTFSTRKKKRKLQILLVLGTSYNQCTQQTCRQCCSCLDEMKWSLLFHNAWIKKWRQEKCLSFGGIERMDWWGLGANGTHVPSLHLPSPSFPCTNWSEIERGLPPPLPPSLDIWTWHAMQVSAPHTPLVAVYITRMPLLAHRQLLPTSRVGVAEQGQSIVKGSYGGINYDLCIVVIITVWINGWNVDLSSSLQSACKQQKEYKLM